VKKGFAALPGRGRRILNRLGRRKQCVVCGRTFGRFTRYGGGGAETRFLERLDVAGSDPKNFGCMYCGAHDRERHLFLFFDRLKLWDRMRGASVLHFAPEANLRRRIGEQAPVRYVGADLRPQSPDVRRIDATAIPFPDASFDFLIANHVLEHIPDYRRALSEFHRVLKPGGRAVLQTPYSRLLAANFEDAGIRSGELRRFFYSEPDHVRIFAESQLMEGIRNAGFRLDIRRHRGLFSDRESSRYGVNPKEDLILAVKPAEGTARPRGTRTRRPERRTGARPARTGRRRP
jgi:SAM-dependent methyltransferase